MNYTDRVRDFIKNNKRFIILLLSLPTLLLFISLSSLFYEPLFVYVYNCHVELISLTIAWIFSGIFIFIFKRLKSTNPDNLIIAIALVIITMIVSYPHAKNIARGRYVFYKHGLYAIPRKDVEHLKSATIAFQKKNWDLSKSHLDSCSKNSKDFFSYSMKNIYTKLERIETSKRNFAIIVDKYELTPSIMKLYESLANDYEGKTLEDYTNVKKTVLKEIEEIEMLYKTINDNDNEQCNYLLSSHGHWWFEKEILEYILNSQDCIATLKEIVMKDDNGLQYKENLKHVWGL